MSGCLHKAVPSVQIEPTYDQLCEAGAKRVLAAANRAIRARGRFNVALSGGTTPRGVYERLATAPLSAATAWADWRFFWGDERWVSSQDPHSNYGMAHAAMLDHLPVVPEQVHPMIPVDCEPRVAGIPARFDLEDAARWAGAYEDMLQRELGDSEVPGQGLTGEGGMPPRLDLALLGLGDDGHTASLFPGSPAAEEERRWVVATPAPGGVEERGLARLTLTLPVLNAAHEAVFLVSGPGKSAVVATVLGEGRGSPPSPRKQPLPAARVLPVAGRLIWLLDAEAASEISRGV